VETIDRRLGKDGRLRPLQAEEVHERIRLAVETNPSSSLRSIAAIAGTSPETVRTFRSKLDRHPSTDLHSGTVTAAKRNWEDDAAIGSCGDGGRFARWFTSTAVDDEWRGYAEAIPISRVYEIADEGRRRAAIWTDFARNIESRADRAQSPRL
jgi:hypothetical protein